QPIPITGHTGIPAFTAMIEKTTGDIYVGTSDGVFIYNGTSWREYEHLKDLPVTSIVQQTFELPIRRALTHTGIDAKNHVFAKTKWPRAIYFGTYGRGIFMDTTYVIDSENEVCDSSDYNHVDIPTVESNGENSVSIYPNPVSGEAHVALSTIEAGNAALRIYDLNGRCVVNRDLGYASEGEQVYTLNTEGMNKGMYLVNVIIGGYTAATKMIVR
ncbi:MAG: T9SS type A sorting domain-containing protein, partial [Bacteroidales bacterium]|nr:T9SS type A sorting domain-containing protein [Bacteroidales bacterium]